MLIPGMALFDGYDMQALMNVSSSSLIGIPAAIGP
jgi:hypothetical protein